MNLLRNYQKLLAVIIVLLRVQASCNALSSWLRRLSGTHRETEVLPGQLLTDSRFNLRCIERVTISRRFVSDEHIQRIQNELQPLRKQILEVEQSVAEGKRKASRTKSEFVATLAPVRSAFRGEPRPRDVENVLQISRNQLLLLEASETATRPAIVPQGPPARIRQYMKGGCTVACLRLCIMCDNSQLFTEVEVNSTWLARRRGKGTIHLCGIERFSNDCRKTKTKAIIPTNHNRNKQHDEPITIPSNYLRLAQSAEKSAYMVRLVFVLLLIG